MNTLFLEPLDALILRGNKLFGDPGSYGEALLPPWPSVAAGAIRSRLLADSGINLAAFAKGQAIHPELGTPADPGAFVVQSFHMARRKNQEVEWLIAPPADVSIVADEHNTQSARRAVPTQLASVLDSSTSLPLHPVLAESVRHKPVSGYWFTQRGFQQYLDGQVPKSTELVHSSELWLMDDRVGVGLSTNTRSAEEGKLFSTQAMVFKPGIGFMVSITGAAAPQSGLLRFGGDGRAVSVTPMDATPLRIDLSAIVQRGRLKLVLSSPGLFSQGWLPNGVRQENDEYRFNLHGVRGRLVCAALPRAEVVSGWDLAQWQPKPAQRIVPTGSVYWLDKLDATPEALDKIVREGLWGEECENPLRRAEGFNRVWLGHW